MIARLRIRQALAAAKAPLAVAAKAIGVSATIIGIGVELARDTLRQRAEAKRLRILDRRRRRP